MRRGTNEVQVGTVKIGGSAPILVQSMCATRTQDIPATLRQIEMLSKAGAGLIRIAIDSQRDVAALKEIREATDANLVVDLQENYRLIADVAPFVQKVRYNPGHLYHHQTELPVSDKVKFIVEHAVKHGCALRVGINFGSLDPAAKEVAETNYSAALNSAEEHVALLQDFGFNRFVVSLKSSDPKAVVDLNREFSKRHPTIPLHLGVTEAGLLPMGEVKTRIAFEQLIPSGIGDTVRVSLTLPFEEKYREIEIGREILEDIAAGRFRSVPEGLSGLNIISCPSCSRVENEAFVKLAEEVRGITQAYLRHNLTIAVMGCRVNGPGESDHADIGLWCAPNFVNLKVRGVLKGAYRYDQILNIVQEELRSMIQSADKDRCE